MSEAERDPHVLVSARIGANQKVLELPSHRARWGWIVILGQAKLQHPAGRFSSIRQLRFLAGEFRDCVNSYLDSGLLHPGAVARECKSEKCRAIGPVTDEEVVVHDWKAHQERASRTTEWRRVNSVPNGHVNKSGNAGGNTGETRLHHTGAHARDAVPVMDVDSRTDGETTTEGVQGEPEREAYLFGLLARSGAFVRPDSGLGIRLHKLIDRRGIERVIEEAERLAAKGPMSDRQLVLGIENAIEAIPSPSEARADDLAAERERREQKRAEQREARRLDWYRNTGQWDEAWGPVPDLATSA